MEFLSDYGLFFAKALTIVIAILIVIAAAVAAGSRGRKEHDGHIEVKSLNDRFRQWEDAVQSEILDAHGFKARIKARNKREKQEAKQRRKRSKAESEERRPRLFVLEFDGDTKASAVENLRREVSAVLTVAEEGDEVLVCLESPGGLVHSYGLAASELRRIRDRGLRLTAAVDKVAASGGYLMACIADRIIAAPFAVVGSIGVVAQLPNFHRLLKKNDIDMELHTAGQYKRTLTLFGENTDEDRAKFLEDLEVTHTLFKQFVADNRPELDMEKVATGEYWYGTNALDLGLVDEIATSDSYLLERRDSTDLYAVSWERRRNMQERLGLGMEAAAERALTKALGLLQSGRFW